MGYLAMILVTIVVKIVNKLMSKEYGNYSFTLSNILESQWGYGAMHPGIFPND